MATKRPYFQFYVNDFAADSVVEAMTTEQVGAYILLLCKAWTFDPQGTLPAEDAALARWARCSLKRWMKIKAGVLKAFRKVDGRYVQKRMTEEAAKVAERALINAQNGGRGGRPPKTDSVISGLPFGSFSETELKAYAGACARSDSEYGFPSPGVGGAGEEELQPAAELAQLWEFACARRDKFGRKADLAVHKIDEFRDALNLGLPFAQIKNEIQNPDRPKREHLWQFWKRFERDGQSDFGAGLREFIARGESK